MSSGAEEAAEGPREPVAPACAGDGTMREIALRFGYLRRVVLAELSRLLAAHDMTPAAYQVLFRLATEGGVLPQQELVLDVELDAAGVSRLLSRMVRRGLLETAVDPADRRRRIVEITARGRALQERLSPEVDAAVRRVVVGLDDDEERALLALLDKAVNATRALHAKQA